MTKEENYLPVEKLPTGIAGFDKLSMGGIPEGRTTIVTGSSGSGKTLFGLEFLWRGMAQYDRNAVFVTFEEHKADIIRNVRRLGWNLDEMIMENRLVILDVAPVVEITTTAGAFDLSGLLQQVSAAVDKIGAKNVVLDSIGALFSQYKDQFMLRQELFRIYEVLREKGVTSLYTTERLEEYGQISRHGVEEFVSDNVIILRNVLEAERCRRTIQVLKYRGDMHHKGEYPFTITTGGINIFSLAAVELKQVGSTHRVISGHGELDAMCGGGFFNDSILLVSGATGTGKTLLSANFANAACSEGNKVVMFAYEESQVQLIRNATSWGMDFQKWIDEGLLHIVCQYPEAAGMEDHLLQIHQEIEAIEPNRVIVDSLSAMERVSSSKVFREFVIGLTAYIKEKNMCGLFTCTTPNLSGGASITETHISSITDAILILRYVEIAGTLRRGIAVIKMRGSQHDKEVHEFTIDGKGLHIGAPFRGVQNIILGTPSAPIVVEKDMLGGMFEE